MNSKNSSKTRVLWVVFLTILALGLIPAAASANNRYDALQEESAPDVPRMTVDQLKEKLAKHQAVTIIDSRSQGAYDGSDTRITGSIRIPLDEIEKHFKELSHSKLIVVYCS